MAAADVAAGQPATDSLNDPDESSNSPSEILATISRVNYPLNDPRVAPLIKASLHNVLDNVQYIGSFATFGTLPGAANPGIIVKDVEMVGLPLSFGVAQTVVAACHQTPFRKGSEMIVDASVRKSWELNAGEFSLQNQAWERTLHTVIGRVAEELGVAAGVSGVRAELYRLLVCGEGAMFKPHNSEKASGMFGTLAICLPSKHEGGNVRISHNGQTKVFDTAKSSEHGYSFMAWYADATHDVKPVISGHRLVLTYNLIYTAPGTPQTASALYEEKQKLHKIFTFWKKRFSSGETACPNMLAYMLGCKYKDAALQSSRRRGSDKLKARYLKEVSTEAGFYSYLANLGRSVEDVHQDHGRHTQRGGRNEDDPREGFHKLGGTCSDKVEVKKIFDLEGIMVAKEIPLKQTDIAQLEPPSKGPGHEGISAIHPYRNTILIIMPQEHNIEFLFEPAKRGKVDVKSWFKRLTRTLQDDPCNKLLRGELSQLCELTVALNKERLAEPTVGPYSHGPLDERKPFSNEVMGEVIKASLLLGNLHLFESALSAVYEVPPLEVYGDIGLFMLDFDVDKILEAYVTAADSSESLRLTQLCRTANTIARYPKIYERLGAIDRLVSGYNRSLHKEAERNEKYPILEQWAQRVIEEALATPPAVFTKDGAALAMISYSYVDSQFIFNRILPLVKAHSTNTAFAVGFLIHLPNPGGGKIAGDVVANVFRDVLADTIDNFTIQLTSSIVTKRQKSVFADSDWMMDRWYLLGQEEAHSGPGQIEGEDVATLVECCVSLGFTDEIGQLFAKISDTAQTVDPSALPHILLPFLGRLLEPLASDNVPLTAPSYHAFVSHLLTTYITRYIRPKPIHPNNWTRVCLGCGCDACNALDEFLISPTRRVGRFPVTKAQRAHLHRKLHGGACKLKTKRVGSLQELVITKTETIWQGQLREWEGRCGDAVSWFEEVGHVVDEEGVREVLREKFKDVVRLMGLEPPLTGDRCVDDVISLLND
ncbi:hypothetical protein FGG08_004501 [Glutinoglossum americanum]|uniref:Prolyl 4-hydroxylase alpha subunit Fe(2+) 2OG dioxygenase domain-containing protein n=1 Tax=Glutinoglossum americanum TaxID=1670608 RepID=A0A9P8I5I7_9PEZI|nr:hypothetical protein FGG08_004501 [Glutinoglossum americanum]